METKTEKVSILAVDRAYTPDRWIDAQTAINLISRGAVQNSFGKTALTLRGGMNAHTGKQSVMEVGSILVIDTKSFLVQDFGYAPLERELLFNRDMHICAYCGDSYKTRDLEMEHVTPECQEGPTSWENLVTSCHWCNQKKGGRTPEQAGMELLYYPYRPSRFEWLILRNRNILGDQMKFLLESLPKNKPSRLQHCTDAELAAFYRNAPMEEWAGALAA